MPLDAHFTLNTGATLPPNMFWMLAGVYQSDSGYFSPTLAFMTPANTISTSYHAPWTTRSNDLLGFVDADSFTINTLITGLNVPQYRAYGVAVRLFPNPSDGMVHIQSAGTLAAIYIYDLNGRVVSHITDFSGNLETVVLPKGTYIAEAIANNGAACRQTVIVQ